MGVRLTEWRESRRLALVVVIVAFVLDSVLVSAIVPMLPDFLKRLQRSEAESNAADATFQNISASHGVSNLQQGSTFVNSSGISNSADAGSSGLSTKIGLLLASKMLFEMLLTPVFGIMGDRFGYTTPMVIGFIVTFFSTLLFAFAESYELLFIARSVQGLGSAAVFPPGIGLLAEKYPDDKERGTVISMAYGGIIFGVLIGPLYGGTMYQFYGKTVTFLILAGVTLIDGCLRAFITTSKHVKKDRDASMKELLTDPYIILVLGGVFFVNFGYSMLEPLLPVWMMDTMNANSAQQGLAFFPTFLTLLLALNTLNRLASRVDRYLMAISGYILIGVSLILIPLAKTQIQLILPTASLGLAIGMVDCAMLPLLSYLVDLRHKSAYGSVYSLDHCMWCFSYMIAASIGGSLESSIGFQWTLSCAGIVGIIFSPLLLFLQNPSTREEEKPLTAPLKPDSWNVR